MEKIAETINGLQHIGLPTNDLEKTVAFYEGLGFSVGGARAPAASFGADGHLGSDSWIHYKIACAPRPIPIPYLFSCVFPIK